jgi:hypothetical protein
MVGSLFLTPQSTVDFEKVKGFKVNQPKKGKDK